MHCEIRPVTYNVLSVFRNKKLYKKNTTRLLTMHQNALPTLPRLLNVRTDLFQQLRIQLLRRQILDIDAIAREAFLLRQHKPGDVEHLDDVRDVGWRRSSTDGSTTAEREPR